METVLLIVSEWSLRQLYHELLFGKDFEVVPVANVQDAILLITLIYFSTAVIYIDDKISTSAVAFLNLRKKHQGLRNTKMILLTSESYLYNRLLVERDVIINSDKLTPPQLAEEIKTSIYGFPDIIKK